MKNKLIVIIKKLIHNVIYLSLLATNFLKTFIAVLVGRNIHDGNKSYIIFQHPDGRIYPVKRGFNWVAFFFAPVWLLVKKIWIHATVVWVINLLTLLVPSLFFGFIYGFKGNELVRKNLLNRGFNNKKDISARNPDDALANFYSDKN